MEKCRPLALGIAFGVVWALYLFFIAISAKFGWGAALIAPIASLYIGYAASIGGAIIGAIWAFVDGFVAGVIIAWIYNAVPA
jgi:hypothetical protein